MTYSECIHSIHTLGFEATAIKVFQYQYNNVSVYRQFCDLLKITPKQVSSIQQIPFLPISFFKTHNIKNAKFQKFPVVFTSSGTTGKQTSRHFIPEIVDYEANFKMNFEYFYGPIEDFVILGLLPSYLERKGSSLIYMVKQMIDESKYDESGFFLNNLNHLVDLLQKLASTQKKVLLIGVSFALLDLVEKYSDRIKKHNFSNLVVMETGGMKGRRKEIIRKELHEKLQLGFGVHSIASEYGMTEMLSQSYATENGFFKCPPSLRFMLRDTEDPFSFVPQGKIGGINFIDLANVGTLSFVATQDLGKQVGSNTFELLGRFDHSDIRGCNLMMM